MLALSVLSICRDLSLKISLLLFLLPSRGHFEGRSLRNPVRKDSCSRFLILLALRGVWETWQGKAASQSLPFSKTQRKGGAPSLQKRLSEETPPPPGATRGKGSGTQGRRVTWARRARAPAPREEVRREGAGPGPPVKPRARKDRNSGRVAC